jgi:stearoyl-CoA desaturase (Delta-9 desaturase)
MKARKVHVGRRPENSVSRSEGNSVQDDSNAVPVTPLVFNPVAANTDLDADSTPGPEPLAHTESPIKATAKVAVLAVIVIPFLGTIAAMALLWGYAFHMHHAVMLLAGYAMTAMGITIGYHRYFTHKSFECVAPVKFALGVMGSMAVEGPVMTWVSRHRRHHQHSDDHDDPHSPHHHGDGVKGVLLGALHAHMGWLFDDDKPGLERYIPDLMASKMTRTVDKLFIFWFILSLIIPAVIGGLVMMTWMGALLGLIWGGLVRIFVVHHITWSINSVCHIWGSQDYKSHDESRNNALFGILAFGEGWHNNHHAFPASARHGLKWWQFDSSYIIIRILEKLGLAWNVKVPSEAHLAKKALAK